MTGRTIAGEIRRGSPGGAYYGCKQAQRVWPTLIGEPAGFHLTGENFGMAGNGLGGPPQCLS